ncbi:hypothetical protein [Nostoc sp.]|uniref:hypothetical protein n=1 Tax=Nostoc sp. TaxID=1180 RepID=UPI002FFD1197
MTTAKSEIAVTNSSSPGITLTLETTGIFLGILVSVAMLAGVATNIISKMNRISFSVSEIQEALKAYASNAEKIKDLDKRLEVHLQDYVNYKDANLLDHNGLRERIDHKWERTEDEFKLVKGSIKDLQGFLQRRDDFKIRE